LYTIAQQHRITIAMASLTSFPTELMGFVVEHLSLEDKVNLVKTCRTTHVAVLPAVYHTVILDTRPTDRKKPPAGTVVGLKRINGLRFTIATRPHLAKHVRRLEAYNYSSTFAGVDFSLEERRAYSQLIDTTCPPMRKHWKKTYTSTRNSILVLSLLLLRCARLEKLSICSYVLQTGGWLQQLLLRISSDQHSTTLPRLSMLSIVDTKDKGIELLQATLELFLSLPGLNTLELSPEYTVSPVLPPRIARTRDADPGRLSTLRIIGRREPYSAFKEILRCTPFLRNLDLDICHTSSEPPRSLKELRTGLNLLRNTLTQLRLRFAMHIDDEFSEITQDVFDGGAGLGSLRHFAALTRLETSLFALVGHNDAVWSKRCPSLADHLPPRLRYLVFFDDLWSEPTFSKIQDLPTMAVFKEFLAGELPAEAWPLNPGSKDLKWIATKEPAWKISTPGRFPRQMNL
jgi:hypothetical protein